MNTTALAIALLVVGVILILFGISESESFSSGISKLFTGSPTNRAMLILIVGVVAAVVGALTLIGRHR